MSIWMYINQDSWQISEEFIKETTVLVIRRLIFPKCNTIKLALTCYNLNPLRTPQAPRGVVSPR